MSRNALLLLTLLPGVIACSSSTSTGNTGDGGTTGDGGSTGGLNGTCKGSDDTQANCQWPQYCLQSTCISPQNVSAQGVDTPSNACETTSSSVQGAGNLDDERATEDAGDQVFARLSAIIIDLQQVPVQSDDDCVKLIGHNTTEYQESAKGCEGGNPDTNGIPICATGEAAIMFTGDVYDPLGHFVVKESGELDGQFYWMTGAQTPINFLDGMYGAVQSGFIIPGANWTKTGGSFVMAQCLGRHNYPLEINSAPVTLHFANTGSGDAGIPGNSYCCNWNP